MKRIILAFLGLIVTCPGISHAVTNESLTLGISAEFETLNPLIANQAATKYLLYFAYRPLVILTPEGKWEPMLITEIPTLKNKLAKKNGKGLDVNIEIIDGAKWGDGTAVTCADIEFAWQVGKNKNVSNASRDPYENISAITWKPETPKKCALAFKLAKYDFYYSMPDPLPVHLDGPVYKKFSSKPEGYDNNTFYTKTPNNPGLYNGPYVITEVKLGSHVVMKPNPHFYGKKPSFKRIVVKLIPNNGVLEANLRSGNIDMIATAAGQGIDQAIGFDKKIRTENLPYEAKFEDGVVYAHIDLNLDNPILADIRVRKALSMAFNKKEMVDSLLEGKGKVAIHMLTDRDPSYTDKVTVYPYNKREAARLLDEAGWKMGATGDYRTKDGKPLRLTLMAAAGAKINENIEAYIQNQYKAVGIDLMLKNEPARVFFGETTKQRKFDMALYSWVSIPDSSQRSIVHSKEIPSKANSFTGQNNPGYKNPEMDKLTDQFDLELDPAKRAELGKKIAEIYTRDIPVIPVYFRPANSVIPKGMKGYQISGHNFYETLFAEDWSM